MHPLGKQIKPDNLQKHTKLILFKPKKFIPVECINLSAYIIGVMHAIFFVWLHSTAVHKALQCIPASKHPSIHMKSPSISNSNSDQVFHGKTKLGFYESQNITHSQIRHNMPTIQSSSQSANHYISSVHFPL